MATTLTWVNNRREGEKCSTPPNRFEQKLENLGSLSYVVECQTSSSMCGRVTLFQRYNSHHSVTLSQCHTFPAKQKSSQCHWPPVIEVSPSLHAATNLSEPKCKSERLNKWEEKGPWAVVVVERETNFSLLRRHTFTSTPVTITMSVDTFQQRAYFTAEFQHNMT